MRRPQHYYDILRAQNGHLEDMDVFDCYDHIQTKTHLVTCCPNILRIEKINGAQPDFSTGKFILPDYYAVKKHI